MRHGHRIRRKERRTPGRTQPSKSATSGSVAGARYSQGVMPTISQELATLRTPQTFLDRHPRSAAKAQVRNLWCTFLIGCESSADFVRAMRWTPIIGDRICRFPTGPAGTRFGLAGCPEGMAAVAFPLRLPFEERSLCRWNNLLMLPETPYGKGGCNGSNRDPEADERWARKRPRFHDAHGPLSRSTSLPWLGTRR